MKLPEFFAEVPKIVLHDPLAEFLGAAGNGILEYGYSDAVKLAGHSCPTVASAYWMTYKALQALYQGDVAERGNIKVEFSKRNTDGVTGVIANVVSLLTGATVDTGFKGIGGYFDRRHKLFFEVDMPGETRFTRLDTQDKVSVSVNLQIVPSSPRVLELMPRCLNKSASAEELLEFQSLWQGRVKAILLDHAEDPRVFAVDLL